MCPVFRSRQSLRHSKFYPLFMEQEGSILCSQQLPALPLARVLDLARVSIKPPFIRNNQETRSSTTQCPKRTVLKIIEPELYHVTQPHRASYRTVISLNYTALTQVIFFDFFKWS
jgi:hypothetical protein